MPADYTAGDPIPRRHHGRLVGESYRDAIDRLAGELRAAEHDRERMQASYEAELGPFHRLKAYTGELLDILDGGSASYACEVRAELRALLGAATTPTAGCGCQYDAAGNVFVDHCVCPDAVTTPTPEPAQPVEEDR